MPIARGLTVAAMALAVSAASAARADEIITKNKLIYRGSVDKDNTLRLISDGLKRVVIRDSKIERIIPGESYRRFDAFEISQPMEVHGGAMPSSAVGIQATPWDAKGRREFRYLNARLATVRMHQAINSLGPRTTGYRGIDGFWKGNVSTTQVPKEVVLGILARVDRTNLNERNRVGSFLLISGWYPEARAEVEAIARDFPAEKERCGELLKLIQDLDARQQLVEIGLLRGSRKPKELLAKLRSLPGKDVSPEVLADAREQLRKEEDQLAADRKLGESLRELDKGFTTSVEKEWKPRIALILKTLEDAPDAARPRLESFAKADPTAAAEAKLALAMSGWIAGPDRASASLVDAQALWEARRLVREYLRAEDDIVRTKAQEGLEAIQFEEDRPTPAPPAAAAPAPKAASAPRPAPAQKPADAKAAGDRKIDLELLTRIIQLMPPPFHGDLAQPSKPITHRVAGDLNPEPTDYMVLLPPEYHPLRSYPAIVSLHDGYGPKHAIDWWAREAARRGYIVIAPEYLEPGLQPDYRYRQREHAAVELALRDARKRYAIDSDRIAIHGVMLGGQGALDIGLAHPDLFSCAAPVSGVPAKFVFTYRKHAKYVPLYIALGDLVPLNRENVFDGFAKPLITDAEDVTYVEYHNRGLEDLPEEAPTVMEWMDKHRRGPAPKAFEVSTGRPCDARFWGVVVQEHQAGRTIAPEAADLHGTNIQPAKISYTTSNISNLIKITATGVNRMDVWVSPKIIDFKKKMEVRINGRAYYKGLAKPDLGQILTDLRYRFDRQQTYWMKVSTGRGG